MVRETGHTSSIGVPAEHGVVRLIQTQIIPILSTSLLAMLLTNLNNKKCFVAKILLWFLPTAFSYWRLLDTPTYVHLILWSIKEPSKIPTSCTVSSLLRLGVPAEFHVSSASTIPVIGLTLQPTTSAANWGGADRWVSGWIRWVDLVGGD